MGWMEVSGGGWSWVKVRARFSNTHFFIGIAWFPCNISQNNKKIFRRKRKISRFWGILVFNE